MGLAATVSSARSVPWAALVPVIVVVVAFVVYCVVDIVRHPDVRHLPRWAWVVICFVSMPLGAIVYLLVGRAENR